MASGQIALHLWAIWRAGWAARTAETHPIGMDAEFARAAGFRGTIGHGLFSPALVKGPKAGMGCFDYSVTAPLYPGDQARPAPKSMSKRPTRTPERGLAA